MAPLRTSPLRIQMIEAAGLALSAWQVRFRGSPARRLTTGPPRITGFSGGTVDEQKEGAWVTKGLNSIWKPIMTGTPHKLAAQSVWRKFYSCRHEAVMKVALFHLFIHQRCCCQQVQHENVCWLSVSIARRRKTKFLFAFIVCIVVNIPEDAPCSGSIVCKQNRCGSKTWLHHSPAGQMLSYRQTSLVTPQLELFRTKLVTFLVPGASWSSTPFILLLAAHLPRTPHCPDTALTCYSWALMLP